MRPVGSLLAVSAALLAAAAQGQTRSNLDLGIFVDRRPTEAEALKYFTGAKHEPKVGCYIGAFIDLDSTLGTAYTDSTGKVRKMPDEFERLVKKPHASYFFYMGYGRPLAIDWVTMLAMQGKIVHIALEPNRGLQYIFDDAYLHKLADDINATGAKVFLRFGSEMNGNWVSYNGDAKLYREKFRLVAKVMRERAPNVAMVWCPYATPVRPIMDYYPGDDVVDWVGVNFYSVTYYNQNKNLPAKHVHPTDLLDYVYDKFSAKKPIMVGEFGATHYSALEKKQQTAFAQRAIRALYSALPRQYPRVKAVHYFNGNNMELDHRMNNNYAVTQNPDVLATYRKVIAADYFLSGEDPRVLQIPDAGAVSIEPVDGSAPERPTPLPVMPMPLRSGEALSGSVKISGWARAHEGGLTLKFFAGSKLLHQSAAKEAWSVVVDTLSLPPGPAVIKVEAWRSGRKVAERSVRVRIGA